MFQKNESLSMRKKKQTSSQSWPCEIDKGCSLLEQWHIQNLSDACTLVWAPMLGAQIKGELMRNNISHLMISSMQWVYMFSDIYLK